jgi:membrane-bound inhibitor of C-type lysozyme
MQRQPWTIIMRSDVRTKRLRSALRRLGLTFILLQYAPLMFASDIVIHLSGNAASSRKQVRYECDAEGAKLGLPNGPFTIEYITGGGNSLVLMPIGGSILILASGQSGSGVRYLAKDYVWWEEAGRNVSLRREKLDGTAIISACKQVK